MFTCAALLTTEVLIVKVALIALAGTVTLAGTVATAVLPLEKITTAPPAGAGALSVTVPVEELPPTTMAGFKLTLVSAVDCPATRAPSTLISAAEVQGLPLSSDSARRRT